MIRINQLKLPEEHSPDEIKNKAAKLLRIQAEQIHGLRICRKSLDARKKPELSYSYVVDVETQNEQKLVHRAKNPHILLHTEPSYRFPELGTMELKHRPVIIGTGPAGLFCGLMLARHGYEPILLERGEDVETRHLCVEHFWKTGELDTRSNVQFGEGGAGTFSDGKLNTLVKDPAGRNRLVLEIFHEFGADASILYESRPHIGTDVLRGIIKRIRGEILSLGGEVRFGCRVTELEIGGGRLNGVVTEAGARIPAKVVVLAVGHSARDTFEMLYEKQIPMLPKPFAVGLRIQHPQKLINMSQYGRADAGALGAASYKVTHRTPMGRGVYSFCMCPGGYVINASSEKGYLAVNGMSYHDRAGENANSALIVTVGPEDFGNGSPLSGVAFQRRLEESAYHAGNGKIPVQLYGDFCKNQTSTKLGQIVPQTCGSWSFANLRLVLPEILCLSLLDGMESFGRMIEGFGRPDAILAGVESRTSSPVRILRDESFQSQVRGLYPCGEGAGYAGGITSAAMDGVKVAEAVAARYASRRFSDAP